MGSKSSDFFGHLHPVVYSMWSRAMRAPLYASYHLRQVLAGFLHLAPVSFTTPSHLKQRDQTLAAPRAMFSFVSLFIIIFSC